MAETKKLEQLTKQNNYILGIGISMLLSVIGYYTAQQSKMMDKLETRQTLIENRVNVLEIKTSNNEVNINSHLYYSKNENETSNDNTKSTERYSRK